MLSRAEFERRWDRHPEIKKAELIDGMVYLEMTVSRKHAAAHGRLLTVLSPYAARTNNVEVLVDGTVRLGGDDLQPDVALRRIEGGGSRVSADDCVEGPPELCVEVAVSSASYDLHQKKDAYRRGRVPEYLVWQVFEQRIDWWALDGDEYVALEPDANGVDDKGIIESRVFPGLRLDIAAMLAGEMSHALEASSSQPSDLPPTA
ncbi:MAG TPA: Uma2 family endonuclease [Candidatus Binataceae bacterium]|nr:Uma2 family endonuclease [Candidatus Binataceae bacterium]